MLTDGSERAKRKAEWVTVFASPEASIHQIDLLECLDSGVVIRRYSRIQNDRKRQNRSFRCDSPPRSATRNQERIPVIDVLHGVPREALRDHVEECAIDRIVVIMREIETPSRLFIGHTLIKTSRFATVPVITVGVKTTRLNHSAT
ncbi:universal stress protein [Natronococcus wangiae]|uniref:universal stress protein n=1 Tax=Natronococcus wangiae TaxID=3068275 RepID=UPI00387E599F